MSIDNEIYNKIHDEYMNDDKNIINDICEEILDENIKDDEIDDTDICDRTSNECMEENDTFNKFLRYNYEEAEEYSHPEESKIYVNRNLKVDFDTKNKMIYLYPGKYQYFTVNVLKSSGDVTVKYKGCCSSEGIRGNLGIYRIIQSGIVVETYYKLNPKKNDILNFTAIDKCTKECYDFAVVFSYNPC